MTVKKGATEKLYFDWNATQRNIARKVIPVVLVALRTKAPVSRRSDPPAGHEPGRFRDSIGFRIQTEDKSTMFLSFLSTSPYAEYIIKGTQGGTLIEPKKTRALRWAVDGGYVFASAVTRANIPANTFNKKVADDLRPFIFLSFRDSIVVVSA
jgi:hypothetical protein